MGDMVTRDRPILFNQFLPIPILTDSLILNLSDTGFNNKYQTDTDFSRNTDKYRLMLINTDYRLNKSVYDDKLYQ